MTREELACVICLSEGEQCEQKNHATEDCGAPFYAAARVEAAGYVKLSPDQTWPKREFYADWGGDSGREGYELAQKDAKAAGFRKVVNP